jgi:hypothetical protein
MVYINRYHSENRGGGRLPSSKNELRRITTTKTIAMLASLVTVTAFIAIAPLLQMGMMQQKAYAYTAYDNYFFSTGYGEGQYWAIDDYYNGNFGDNQWAEDPKPCYSGDYHCLEIYGWRIGYFDTWCELTGECYDYSTQLE